MREILLENTHDEMNRDERTLWNNVHTGSTSSVHLIQHPCSDCAGGYFAFHNNRGGVNFRRGSASVLREKNEGGVGHQHTNGKIRRGVGKLLQKKIQEDPGELRTG